jgi:hypothetical protein
MAGEESARDSGRRLLWMVVSLAAFFAVVAAVNFAVNPYGAWRTALIEPGYREDKLPIRKDAGEEGAQRVATAYRLQVSQPTTVLVGSSRIRSGMRMYQAEAAEVFNAAVSGAALGEIAAILDIALENPLLKRVIWGVDFFAFDESFPLFRFNETLSRLSRDDSGALRRAALRVGDTLLSLQALEDSWKTLRRKLRGEIDLTNRYSGTWPAETIAQSLHTGPPYKDPSLMRLLARHREQTREQMADWTTTYAKFRLSPAAVSQFRQTVAEVRARGVEVILLVPPMSECDTETIDASGRWGTFQEWKRLLLDAGGPYWDFSGYTEVSGVYPLFSDVLHFRPAVGHVILRSFLGAGCAGCGEQARAILESGTWVDSTTIDAHLAKQSAERDRHAELPPSLCSELAHEVVRAGRR